MSFPEPIFAWVAQRVSNRVISRKKKRRRKKKWLTFQVAFEINWYQRRSLFGNNQIKRGKISTTFCPLYSHTEKGFILTQSRIPSSYRGTRKLLMKLGTKKREPIKYRISALWKKGYEMGHQGSESHTVKTIGYTQSGSWDSFSPPGEKLRLNPPRIWLRGS